MHSIRSKSTNGISYTDFYGKDELLHLTVTRYDPLEKVKQNLIFEGH